MSSAYATLLERVNRTGVGASDAVNLFWQRQLKYLGRLLKANRNPSADEVIRALGYYETPLPAGVGNADLPTWAAALAAAREGDTSGLTSKAQWEHAGALAVLDSIGRLGEYLQLVDSLGLESGPSLARHYYYRRRLAQWIAPNAVCLEVGAGGGHLAMLLARAGFVRHYVIADLPEMLLNSCATLQRYFPEAQMRVGERPDFTGDDLTFWLLDTREIALVPDDSVDLALNFNSFMEMDEAVRDFYIAQIYRAGRAGSIFCNANRLQRRMFRRDGSVYDSNPLLYPYALDDEVLMWEPDLIQEGARSRLFSAPVNSFAMMRVSRLA